MAKLQHNNLQGTDMEAFFEKAAEEYGEIASTMKDIAREVITWMPPITSSSVVLDNAAGPGIVSEQILQLNELGSTPDLYATDFSAAMIAKLQKSSWSSKVKSAVMDARDLDFPNDKFTRSFTNFAVMAMPEAEKATSQIYRTLKPGGTAIVTTWKMLGYLVIFQDAQKAVNDRPVFQGPISPEWMSETKLRSAMETGGFRDVEIKTCKASMSSDVWATGLDFMKGMLISQITKDWTEEEQEQYKVALQKQLQAEKMNPRLFPMIAWVAIARK